MSLLNVESDVKKHIFVNYVPYQSYPLVFPFVRYISKEKWLLEDWVVTCLSILFIVSDIRLLGLPTDA